MNWEVEDESRADDLAPELRWAEAVEAERCTSETRDCP